MTPHENITEDERYDHLFNPTRKRICRQMMKLVSFSWAHSICARLLHCRRSPPHSRDRGFGISSETVAEMREEATRSQGY
ncbi:hypothetical protein IEQ34_022835 [Dendrobium chrysotoxum]|uniref:Uncharacterized protein n=1 Tax=Dendrobium chrysotoxum TaxID=161865 RepID=A0AAV7FYL2_DENCH|nr:hypothetical protein IEQ34_022835 [Dendrobium chrysotoxum]